MRLATQNVQEALAELADQRLQSMVDNAYEVPDLEETPLNKSLVSTFKQLPTGNIEMGPFTQLSEEESSLIRVTNQGSFQRHPQTGVSSTTIGIVPGTKAPSSAALNAPTIISRPAQ